MTLLQHTKQICTGLVFSFGLVSSAFAYDSEDVLGDFLQQNFPGQFTTVPAANNHAAPTAQQQPAYAAPLLNAQAAAIMNANTGQILFQKNINSVRSIASISKLMAAMVVLDARLDMGQTITITEAEIDRLKGTGSRLSVGTELTRTQLLHLGLMSSENRAIHALARTYPGGMSAFVQAMNAKAQSLGMRHTRFYEPTGLDPRNVSTASANPPIQHVQKRSGIYQRWTRSAVSKQQCFGARRPLEHQRAENGLYPRGRPLHGAENANGSRPDYHGGAGFVHIHHARERCAYVGQHGIAISAVNRT